MTDSSENAKRFLVLRAARELRIVKMHDSAKMRDYSTQPKAARIKGPKKTSTKPSPANPWAYIERHQAIVDCSRCINHAYNDIPGIKHGKKPPSIPN